MIDGRLRSFSFAHSVDQVWLFSGSGPRLTFRFWGGHVSMFLRFLQRHDGLCSRTLSVVDILVLLVVLQWFRYFVKLFQLFGGPPRLAIRMSVIIVILVLFHRILIILVVLRPVLVIHVAVVARSIFVPIILVVVASVVPLSFRQMVVVLRVLVFRVLLRAVLLLRVLISQVLLIRVLVSCSTAATAAVLLHVTTRLLRADLHLSSHLPLLVLPVRVSLNREITVNCELM